MFRETLRTKQLQHARPKLKLVSPMAHWTITVMVAFNIVLGLSLFFLVDENKFAAPLLIVNDILTFRFWGIVFVSLGLLKAFSLYSNRWELGRASLFIGVAIKAAWAVALIIRVIVSPGTFFLALLWVTVALLQMGAYIWFLPHGFMAKTEGK